MKRFQSLLASFVLTFILAASAAAGDGIIHTGRPAASPTPPAEQTSDASDGGVEGETAEGEETMLDLFTEAALYCLQSTFTLL